MQLALIVDDSKTSRVMLKKMLERQHVSVECVESGEDALTFLQNHHPDVIFMDHIMPGMDGFAAVKAIKSDPAKLSIPIVMYTSKAGDIYVGQARALGAVDILSKPADDEHLQSVLEHVAQAREALTHAEIDVRVVSHQNEDDSDHVKEPSVDVEASTPKRDQATERVAEPTIEARADYSYPNRRSVLAIIGLIFICALAIDNAFLSKNIQQQVYHQSQLLKTLEWALNQQESYDYGEIPLSDDRLERLIVLVERLNQSGYQGLIRIEAHVGEFCLSRVALEGGGEAMILPSPELPLTACDVLGMSTTRAMDLSIQANDAFKRYLNSEALLATGIRVKLVPFGAAVPHFNYPSSFDGVTTGDWNSIALRNNRVKFVLVEE